MPNASGLRRNSVREEAHARFLAHLGAWQRGWTRETNLSHWLARAVRVCASELGLPLDVDGTVCGDHLVAIVNRALQTLSWTATCGPQYDTEFPPLTVDELRRLIAAQPASARQLHYAFDTQSGHLRVGCFHDYAVPHTWLAPTDERRAPWEICLGRAQLEQRLPAVVARKKRRTADDVEGWLLRRLAAQPLDALHFTHRFVQGELRLTHHVPPLAYRPVETPLLLNAVGAPLRIRPSATHLRLYHPLTGRQHRDVAFHDTTAAHVGGILDRGLVPVGPAVHLWSWATAPARSHRRHDARFYVHLHRAAREGGLRFFMSNEGSILCPSPIPMRFLELAEEAPMRML